MTEIKWIDLSQETGITDKKLALDHKITEEMREVVRLGVLKFGKVSIPYLMRKLKCSPSMAKEVMKGSTSDNVRDVDSKKNSEVKLKKISLKTGEVTYSTKSDEKEQDQKFKRSFLTFRD